MLVQSFRLVVVTLDGEGNIVSRRLVEPVKVYGWENGSREQAEIDAKKVQLGPNQRVEIEAFLDSSKYEEGWKNGLIF